MTLYENTKNLHVKVIHQEYLFLIFPLENRDLFSLNVIYTITIYQIMIGIDVVNMSMYFIWGVQGRNVLIHYVGPK